MARPTNQSMSLRRDQFISSWRELAAQETFANRSLAQFEAETAAAIEVRERIQTAQTQLAALLGERKNADKALNDLMILIAHAVRGNPAYGENSPLYRALGYVPKSERKSGLRRGGQAAATSPAKDAGAI